MSLSINPIVTVSDISSIVQAFSNIILLFLTGYFAFLTKKTILEMTKQRDSGIMPLVVADSFSFSDEKTNDQEHYCVECKLKNVGSGAALNVRIFFYNYDTNQRVNKHFHEIDYLPKDANETHHIHISKKEFNNTVMYRKDDSHEMRAALRGEIHFNNIYGKHYKVEQGYAAYKQTGKYFIDSVLGTMKFNAETG